MIEKVGFNNFELVIDWSVKFDQDHDQPESIFVS